MQKCVVSVLEVGDFVGNGKDLDCETATVSLTWWLEKLKALSGSEDLHLDVCLASLGRIDEGPELPQPIPLHQTVNII